MLLCIRLIDPPLRPEQGVASSGLRTQGAYQRVHAWCRVASSIVVTRASVHPRRLAGKNESRTMGRTCPTPRPPDPRLIRGRSARTPRFHSSVVHGTGVALEHIVRTTRREDGKEGPPMYRRVLVALDGSLVAEGIIPFIMQIAGPLDIQVVLLRVLVPVPAMAIEGTRQVEDAEKHRAEAEEYLAGMARELRDKGVRATTEVRRGEPVAKILEGAREAKADLIAMTTHGRSGLGRLLFGSVAEAVLRQADIPVFLMRLPDDRTAARAAWPEERR